MKVKVLKKRGTKSTTRENHEKAVFFDFAKTRTSRIQKVDGQEKQ